MPGREAEDMPTAPDAERRTRRIDEDFSFAHGGGFAAAVLVIMFSEQAFLNAGPLIIRGLQGAAAAGFIFNVLMIARAPLQLFQAVSTSILPHLTSLHTSDRARQRARVPPHGADGPARARRLHRAGRCVVVLIAGPKADADRLQQEVHLRPRRAAAGHASGWASTSASVTRQPGLHRPGPGAARRGCAGSPAPALFIGWNFVPLVSDEFRRVEIGFLLAAGVLFSLLYFVYRRPHERAEDVPGPGSPRGARGAPGDARRERLSTCRPC